MIEDFEEHSPAIDARAFVHAMATVIGEVYVGAESSVWPSAVLRGDDGPIRIGACSSIQDGTVVHNYEGFSKTSIGDRVTVGHNATLHGCTIEDDCLIGMGAIILDNAVVRSGSIIGAGALVPAGKEIPAGSLVFGNPCRVVRPVGAKDRALIESGWRAYQTRAAQYLRKSSSLQAR